MRASAAAGVVGTPSCKHTKKVVASSNRNDTAAEQIDVHRGAIGMPNLGHPPGNQSKACSAHGSEWCKEGTGVVASDARIAGRPGHGQGCMGDVLGPRVAAYGRVEESR